MIPYPLSYLAINEKVRILCKFGQLISQDISLCDTNHDLVY